MKQTLLILFIFTAMVGAITVIYKLASPYVDVNITPESGVEIDILDLKKF